MLALGFDSAGAGASAAILRDGAVVAARSVGQERGQAEILMPMIADLFDEVRIDAGALDLIGVAIGPGSFTGLRIAIAAARGLALAAGVPALGVSSFAAIATRLPPAARGGRALLVALETRRDDFYLQLFAAGGPGEPLLSSGEAAAAWLPRVPLLLAGDAARRLTAALAGHDVAVAEDVIQVRAEDVARLAAAEYRPGIAMPPPRPLYLRPPDTTMPKAVPP
jgi:tRNA threonylcarbamoyladenosine biosynthesis protein TsaB